jgi:dTDP-4-amino-4,6-dideoxygalactose transaminase
MDAGIPFVDLAGQHAPLREELGAAFDRVIDASGFILGEEVERFEAEFAEYCGVRHCVGVASGTAALTLAMSAVGVGPGDEVIVPAHTFIASALGVLHAGATPVLCDVEPGTGLMDVDSAATLVTERTAAVLPVHLYGQACDMGAVRSLAGRHGIAVIEDAAQAHGATYGGRRAGSLGTAAAFSFYPSKNLGALGDGGAICTDDEEIARNARALRDLGQRKKGEHSLPGYNERLDGLQAALLRVKLPHLARWNESRRQAAAAYRSILEGRVGLLEEHPRSYHLFPIRVDDRGRLAARLADAGISTGVHYPLPLHEQPALAKAARADQAYPSAGAWAREELSLPIFDSLGADRAQMIAERCAAVL